MNVILDPVGGDRFTDSLRSLGTQGRLLVVAAYYRLADGDGEWFEEI